MCRSNWSLRHNKKGTERKIKHKSINTIYPVTRWFEITQYDEKRAISIANLVEVKWLTIYPRQI